MLPISLIHFEGECSEVLLDPIVKQTTSLKCAVYQDLWEKGHYVTTGEKFGGDFLVYLGIYVPIRFLFYLNRFTLKVIRLHFMQFISLDA